MPEPLVIKLRRAVGEITELRLREPTAGEVLAASRESGRGVALSLLRQVTGTSAATIEALPGSVSDKALAHLMTFIEPVTDTPEDATAEAEPPEEMALALETTLQIGTTWVSELTLREPTLGELIKADKYTGMQRTVVLVALAAGQPRAVVELLPISVFAKAAAYVMGFTDAAPSIGGASSSG